MRHYITFIVSICLCVFATPDIRAQDAADASADSEQAEVQPAPPKSAPRPMPGEEVMRPSESSLRMTPNLARSLSRMLVAQLAENNPLTPDQKSELQTAFAKRIMESARANEEIAQAAIEHILETAMQKEMARHEFTADDAREFGRRIGPGIAPFKGLIRGMAEDCNTIAVDPKQQESVREELEDALKELDKIEERMNRWANGEYKRGEDPFDNYAGTQPAAKSEEKPGNPEMRFAEQRAENIMRSLEPVMWERFVIVITRFFNFDKEQSDRARQILADYKARAETIMTPEWKQQIRENRRKQYFRDAMSRKQNVAPWSFHLQYEYNKAMKPLVTMGDEFRKEILALVTSEQRDTAFAGIRQRAGAHGLDLESSELALFGLSTE